MGFIQMFVFFVFLVFSSVSQAELYDVSTPPDSDSDGIPDSEDSSIVTVDVNFPNVSISIERTGLADNQAIVWSDLRLFSPSGCRIEPFTHSVR